MQLLVFVLAYPLLWIISRLPHRLFYAFSDFICLIVYRLVGYRTKVVRNNLRLVFPEKPEAELKSIEKKFYSHLCDTFLEMVKTMSISTEKIKKKYNVINPDMIHNIEKEKTVLVVCSHYANWEWNVSINNYFCSKGYAVYQKIGNPYFDRWIRKIRSRWNTTLITQKQVVPTVVKNHKNGVRGIFGMVSDQSPQKHLAHYWTEFMGIKVPVVNGAEIMARKMDLAVVFLKVSKVKRGFYDARFTLITDSGSKTSKNEITDAFLRLTEQQILERPEHYLWTHRRWKHRDKVPEKFKSE
ncbi:lipid A biosynthesis acyltransferase [Euzebyella marina]|uniref:Lipid A biosynthesis acyltransferase n=1 Tax=Euzebyella marina TaxID=1761453 RepID=A0A3G2L7C4_9FLAO|nr:lysophospholipid acyltransferase family protein [Euzebyella marina]AYN68155.1 lipid A biosynthesis acyltransferase [Euzebyella marina]